MFLFYKDESFSIANLLCDCYKKVVGQIMNDVIS